MRYMLRVFSLSVFRVEEGVVFTANGADREVNENKLKCSRVEHYCESDSGESSYGMNTCNAEA